MPKKFISLHWERGDPSVTGSLPARWDDSPPSIGFSWSLTNNPILTSLDQTLGGLLRICCVPAGSVQQTCCRQLACQKTVSMCWTETGITFGVYLFQEEFTTHWSFQWTGAKEEFAHNQPLVSAGWWQIVVKMRGQLQGPLLREGKGNFVGKASEGQS